MTEHSKVKKASGIISKLLEEEREYKLTELAHINRRLQLTEEYLDRLRAYTLACFYTDEQENSYVSLPKRYPILENESATAEKHSLIVGNVSKYILADQRDNLNDKFTYKWLLYVRTPPETPPVETFVSKVQFKLDPSYIPNDEYEVTEPPFEVRQRGWGEFPVKCRIFFGTDDQYIDVTHQLSLDTTFSGVQTPGAETIIEVEFSAEPDDKPKKKITDIKKYTPANPKKKHSSANHNSSSSSRG